MQTFVKGTISPFLGSNWLTDAFLANAPLNRSGSEVAMFEDSFVVSQVSRIPASKQWTLAGSVALQIGIAVALAALPLLHPDKLALHTSTSLIFTPPPPRPPNPPVQSVRTSSTPSGEPSSYVVRTLAPILSHDPARGGAEAPLFPSVNPMPTASTFPAEIIGIGTSGPRVSPPPQPATPRKPMRVSEGVSAGLLLSPIRPIYPAIAKAAGISGTVMVEAVISKSGTIESLQVMSGPEMLRRSALDAIRAARYQPFRLSGEPIEVQTTITVNFRLGS